MRSRRPLSRSSHTKNSGKIPSARPALRTGRATSPLLVRRHPAGFTAAVSPVLLVKCPGPALLNVRVAPMELEMPPFTALGPAYGMAMYSLKAILNGKGSDVFEMIQEHIQGAPTV